MRVDKSYCRLCQGFCGMDVTIDEHERVVEVRGDHENPATLGYACVKGLGIPEILNSPDRLLHPLKRVGDRHVRIDLEQALDEIGAKMRQIIDEDGAQSLGFFRGTGTFGSTIAVLAFPALANAVGGQRYSTMTIDQSAKWVAAERLGVWSAGKDAFEQSDVFLFAGANPLVSVYSWHTPVQNPMKRLKEAKARGTKIIVIDPRACEIAKFADIHLQILPGQDSAVVAGLLNIILSEGWEDKVFCAQHVHGLERLREAVKPFSPALVASRAGIRAEELIAAADLFARQSKRGSVNTGTGTSMAPHCNLTEHLYECLGIVCGRFLREGEQLPNPGVILSTPKRAEVLGPSRNFEKLPKSRVRGAVRLMGESASPTLAEDILEPGPGRVRGLLVSGANPVAAIPDPLKVTEAFRSLDLLVTIDPRMTATARLAHYILPPKILFEHADMTYALEMTNLSYPYAQYTPALVPPPPGSQLCDEGYIPWALAKRLGKTLTFDGIDLDMNTAPTDDDYLALLARRGNVPFEELKKTAQDGRVYDVPARHVEPASPNAGRFDVFPDDVAAELGTVLAMSSAIGENGSNSDFGFRLIPRRIRETCNTSYHELESTRRHAPYNPLSVHPDDLSDLGMNDGDWVELVSEHDRIPAILKADDTLKPGVVSMTHGYGGGTRGKSRLQTAGLVHLSPRQSR